MIRWAAWVAVLLAAAVAAGTAQAPAQDDTDCMDDPLGPVPGYNIVTLGDLDLMNTDSEGRMVVGRDATLTSFGVASRLPVDPARVDLAVGRDFTANNVGINQGSATYGRNLSGNATTPNGTLTKAAPPFDVGALFAGLAIRSASWADLEPNGEISGRLTFTGTDESRNVFTLSASRLAGASEIRIRVPVGSTTLINVTGSSYFASGTSAITYWDGSGYVQMGNEAPSEDLERLRTGTLWNFADATSVDLRPSIAWQGTILAPRAVVTLGYQQVNGPIVAGALYGTGETHIHPPDVCLPDPTPCPPQPPIPTPTPTPTVTPTPTPEPSPTPTPTPTPTPEPTPTPTPRPIVTPTPTPPNHDPSEPLGPDETPGTVVVRGEQAEVRLCKKVMTPRGRALESVRRHAGGTARFRIRVTNLGTSPARNVRVCDALPRDMTLLRASAKPSFRRGRPCWRIPVLEGQRQGFLTVRLSRTASGRVTNTAVISGDRNTARVRVLPARSRGGGVTG